MAAAVPPASAAPPLALAAPELLGAPVPVRVSDGLRVALSADVLELRDGHRQKQVLRSPAVRALFACTPISFPASPIQGRGGSTSGCTRNRSSISLAHRYCPSPCNCIKHAMLCENAYIVGRTHTAEFLSIVQQH